VLYSHATASCAAADKKTRVQRQTRKKEEP
jgi:hypothetical protein